jgi:hypothetical protein
VANYGDTEVSRSAIYVKDSYFVIKDSLRSKKWHEYKWLFQYYPRSELLKLKEFSTQRRFLSFLNKKDVYLTTYFLMPQPDSFKENEVTINAFNADLAVVFSTSYSKTSKIREISRTPIGKRVIRCVEVNGDLLILNFGSGPLEIKGIKAKGKFLIYKDIAKEPKGIFFEGISDLSFKGRTIFSTDRAMFGCIEFFEDKIEGYLKIEGRTKVSLACPFPPKACVFNQRIIKHQYTKGVITFNISDEGNLLIF